MKAQHWLCYAKDGREPNCFTEHHLLTLRFAEVRVSSFFYQDSRYGTRRILCRTAQFQRTSSFLIWLCGSPPSPSSSRNHPFLFWNRAHFEGALYVPDVHWHDGVQPKPITSGWDDVFAGWTDEKNSPYREASSDEAKSLTVNAEAGNGNMLCYILLWTWNSAHCGCGIPFHWKLNLLFRFVCFSYEKVHQHAFTSLSVVRKLLRK